MIIQTCLKFKIKFVSQVAEKTSKFKVDTESRNKITQSQNRMHKSGREKRPSMQGEYSTTGRMRGSYGNIHHGSSRNTFGSNRAISLDQYSAGNRRLSDGIQTVTSDSSVYYNQHSHQPQQIIPPVKQKSDDVLLVGNKMGKLQSRVADDEGSKLLNNENSRAQCNNCTNVMNNNRNFSTNMTSNTIKLKSGSNSSNNNNFSSTSSSKTLLARLRNLTGKLSFSFDKESRRLSSNSISSGVIANKISQSEFQAQSNQQLVTIAPPSPSKNAGKANNNYYNINSMDLDMSKKATNSNRGRAFSLDVPPSRFNFNNSNTSSNDGSRKSLVSSIKNDDSLGGSTNSNTTLSNQDNSIFVNNSSTAKGRPSEVDTLDGVDI